LYAPLSFLGGFIRQGVCRKKSEGAMWKRGVRRSTTQLLWTISERFLAKVVSDSPSGTARRAAR